MTFGSILQDVYEDTGLTDAPPASVIRRIKKNINKAQTMILRDPTCARLRYTMDQSVQVTTEADIAVYGVTAALSDVTAVFDRDNDRKLDIVSPAELDRTDPGRSSTGTPYAVAKLGYKPLARPFATAGSGIWVASSSASDTGQTVSGSAVLASGLRLAIGATTLTGTSRVQIGTATTIVDILSIRLSAVAVGTVSFYDAASGGNLLGQIGIGQTAPQYCCIQFGPTPAGPITYYLSGIYRIADMSADADVPMLPEEFHDILGAYGRMCEYEKANDDRLPLAAAEWNRGLKQLRFHLNSGVTYMAPNSRPRVSRFGPWTPAE